MGEQKLYTAQAGWLNTAVEKLCAAGVEVYAPVEQEPGMVNLTPVTSAENIASDFINIHLPLKEVFFPRTEVLLDYQIGSESEIGMDAAPLPDGEKLVMGCRPCDAAGLSVFDTVFQWDYDDVRFKARRDQCTIMSWACAKSGPACFCTSVGGSPNNTVGSDVLAYLTENGDAIFQVLTERGEKLIERLDGAIQPAADNTQLPAAPELERQVEPEKVKTWLDENFENDFWTDVSLRCLGCGLCSYLCPTCHCFDIVDEACWNCGERRRNWDCCSFRQFTVHASGHNPRPDQTSRCRQRVMHKFKYFPDRFDQLACVGCGRCIRNCGVGQNLVSILAEIQSR